MGVCTREQGIEGAGRVGLADRDLVLLALLVRLRDVVVAWDGGRVVSDVGGEGREMRGTYGGFGIWAGICGGGCACLDEYCEAWNGISCYREERTTEFRLDAVEIYTKKGMRRRIRRVQERHTTDFL